MKQIFKLACVCTTVLLIYGPATATTFDAGLWTEFYSFEQKLPEEQSRLRSLQGARLRISDALIPGLSLYARGRVASDLANKFSTDPDTRIFGAYLEYARKNWLTVRAGRQFLSPGLNALTLDGGRIDLSYRQMVQLTGYAGTLPGPTFYDLDQISSWKERNAFGGQLKLIALKPWTFSLAYAERNFDENLESRAVGFSLDYSKKHYNALGRIDYDLYFKQVKLIVVRPRLTFNAGHSIGFEYFYRHPSFGLSNPFSVIASEPFHQFRLNPVYKITESLSGVGSMAFTQFEDDNYVRVSLGAAYRGQSLGGVFSEGYNSRRYGLFASLFYDLTKQLRAYFYGDMFEYKLDTEEEDPTPSVSSALGATYDIGSGLSARAEGQLLSNRDYEYDTRFYLRLSYALHTVFGDNSLGGGSSR